jgi:outer membrane protein insertion porin family
VGILNVPHSRAQSNVEGLPFKSASVNPADSNDRRNAPAIIPVAPDGGGGPLLLAQTVPVQAVKPQGPARSSTQRIRFEEVPEAPQPPRPKASGPTIEAIEFRGTRRIPQFALRAVIASRAGGAYDTETLRRDAQALYNTGRFSDISWTTEPGPAGIVVRFVVVERPLIQTIEYQGDDTVTIDEILERFKQRNLKLKPETLYNEDELGRAAVAIQELVEERGRENITVTPSVEPTWQPLTVKIIFRVVEKE